jgi:hypothetical protein
MLSPASGDHEGAASSNSILEDSNNPCTSEPLVDLSMQSSDDEAELTTQ